MFRQSSFSHGGNEPSPHVFAIHTYTPKHLHCHSNNCKGRGNEKHTESRPRWSSFDPAKEHAGSAMEVFRYLPRTRRQGSRPTASSTAREKPQISHRKEVLTWTSTHTIHVDREKNTTPAPELRSAHLHKYAQASQKHFGGHLNQHFHRLTHTTCVPRLTHPCTHLFTLSDMRWRGVALPPGNKH